MGLHQKVLLVDAGTGFYRVARHPVGDFFGPVDLGLHLSGRHDSLNLGVGLLAGSIFPGSNRLIVTGRSPCWHGFFVSSMGGAGLVFDNLGLNLVSIVGRAPRPSILVLNREHGEEIDVRLEPVELHRVWQEGRGGVYGLLDHAFARFAGSYQDAPRVLAVGPAAEATDFGAIGSAPVANGRLTDVDTWAGRGGMGSKLLHRLNRHADRYGFDGISAGGVLAWLMECLDTGALGAAELGVSGAPAFSPDGFAVEADSMNNAELGVRLLDAIVERRGVLDLREGARKLARRLAREKGRAVLDPLVITAFGRDGWMVPNQYWTPGVLSPMAIMGKYYMHYGNEFVPPRSLGRFDAERFRAELVLDDLGMCRFHRGWAEEMLPEVVGALFGKKDELLRAVALTAVRINSRNAGQFWDSGRNVELVATFLARQQDVEGATRPELAAWRERFAKAPREAAYDYWYEIHKGIHEALREA